MSDSDKNEDDTWEDFF
ncbi:hypothetical protein TcasGA2_TC035028, partial [Tribolium castaneum]